MYTKEIPVLIQNEKLLLHPHKCVFWVSKKILWIADLHLGKRAHFNNSGIPIPAAVSDENWKKLYDILDLFNPDRVLFLGDLFHSKINAEWEILGRYLNHFRNTSFELVRGNHDILSAQDYQLHQILVHDEFLWEPPFYFTHHPLAEVNEHQYNVCGHIHPAVRLRGKGRQSLRIPCFYFGKYQAILPAFGAFTGTARITPSKKDQVFLIAENQILPFSTLPERYSAVRKPDIGDI